jgi:hypothetical protein
MDQNTVHDLLQKLEHVYQRPANWIDQELPAAATFLFGVDLVCQTLGIYVEHEQLYERIVIERGWSSIPHAPWIEMREKGLSENEISKELIYIRMELLKRYYNI